MEEKYLFVYRNIVMLERHTITMFTYVSLSDVYNTKCCCVPLWAPTYKAENNYHGRFNRRDKRCEEWLSKLKWRNQIKMENIL